MNAGDDNNPSDSDSDNEDDVGDVNDNDRNNNGEVENNNGREEEEEEDEEEEEEEQERVVAHAHELRQEEAAENNRQFAPPPRFWFTEATQNDFETSTAWTFFPSYFNGDYYEDGGYFVGYERRARVYWSTKENLIASRGERYAHVVMRRSMNAWRQYRRDILNGRTPNQNPRVVPFF